MKIFLVLALMGVSAEAISAQRVPVIPSQSMTCEQAVAFYAKYKRIYTIANGRDIVPIYGSLPKDQKRNLRCMGRKRPKGRPVRTKDNNFCVVGVYCSSS